MHHTKRVQYCVWCLNNGVFVSTSEIVKVTSYIEWPICRGHQMVYYVNKAIQFRDMVRS